MKYRLKGFIAAAALAVSCNSFAVDDRLTKNHRTLTESRELVLTPEQLKKIERIKLQTEQRIETIDASDICASALPDTFESGKWDGKAITQALDEESKIQARIRYYQVRYLFEVSQVLTDTQRKTFIAMLKRHEFD